MKKNKYIKYVIVLILINFIINILSGCDNFIKLNNNLTSNLIQENNSAKNKVLNYDDVKNSLIRFHVIANSDNDKDQKLKIKVKDAVINYLYPFLSNSKSLDESRELILRNESKVKNIANQIIKDNNYNYDVRLELSRENFPEKSYGNIVLPQGNYEAFRIIIGQGKGKNWWCVMFPPLCFVDETKAVVEYNKTEENIKKAIKENEKDNTCEDSSKIEYKFKCLEIIQRLFK